MPDATHVLRSNNILRYRHEIVPGRGGLINGEFRDPPSPADAAEATEFMKSLMVPGGIPVVEGISDAETQRRVAAAFRDTLYGGSNN